MRISYISAIALLVSSAFGEMLMGNSWTAVRSGHLADLRSVIWTGTKYLAIGDAGIVYSSVDGSVWATAGYGPRVPAIGLKLLNGKYYAACQTGVYVSSDSYDWTKILSTTSTVYDITQRADTIIAVGDRGKTYRSIAGEAWDTIKSNTSERLYSVIYALGAYYAAGGSIILKSTNSAQWDSTHEFINGSGGIYSIASNGKSLVIAGQLTAQFSLDSGKTWRNVSGEWGDIQNHVMWDGKQYIVASWDGTINYLTSDSTSVRVRMPTGGGIKSIASSGKNYAAVGLNGSSSYTSDITNWQTGYPWQSKLSFAYDKWFIISDRNTYYTSSDGSQWKRITIPGREIWKVINKRRSYLAIGRDGDGTSSERETSIYSSPDGENWTIDTTISGITLNDIVEFNEAYYATGTSGTIIKSDDGKNWEIVRQGGAQQFQKLLVAYGNMFACGDSIYRLIDGNDWDPVSIELDGAGSTLRSMVHDGEKFIASSGPRIYTSSDGLTWTIPDPFTLPYKFELKWNGKEIIAYSSKDISFSKSVNGTVWAEVYGDLPDEIIAIESSGSTMIAIGRHGSIYMSRGSFFTRVEPRSSRFPIIKGAHRVNGSLRNGHVGRKVESPTF